MTDADPYITLVLRMLGNELREAREACGWSRAALAKMLPSGTGDVALRTYELGIRQVSVARFIEICTVLGVAAHDLLGRALKNAEDVAGLTVRVRPAEILADRRAKLAPLRGWARRRLDAEPDHEIVPLPPVATREMAAALGYTHEELVRYLMEFQVVALRL